MADLRERLGFVVPDWIGEAPCAKGPGSETDHDLPAYLRGTRRQRELIRTDPKVASALASCARCPFRTACLELTRPRHYDGVCGGLVFINGDVVGGLAQAIRRTA